MPALSGKQKRTSGRGDGLRVGKTVEMLTNDGGPILLRTDESRIAMGRGVAI